MMKKYFRGFALAAAASAALLAAIPAASSAKEITVAVSATFSTLDPYDAPDILTRLAAKSMYEGLFSFDSKMQLVPELAESYTVTPDAKVFTITLKKGVKFHDGTEFTADAVKMNFDRLLNPDNHLSRY